MRAWAGTRRDRERRWRETVKTAADYAAQHGLPAPTTAGEIRRLDGLAFREKLDAWRATRSEAVK
jgi:hypothetical protein